METLELFEILPPGFFTTPEELQDFIDQEGVDDLYQLVPKETFPTLEDFQVSLKKKDSQEINTELQSPDGSSEQFDLPEISVEEDGFFERNLGKSGITDLLDDTTNSIRQGFAQGASLKQALKLQRKGSRATKEDIDRYEAAVRKMQSIPVTDEQRSFNKIYEENDKSWLGFVKGIYKNPSVLSGVILQSVASMINPTVAFGAIKGGAIGAVTAGAAGAAGGAAFGGPGGAAAGGLAGLQQGAKYGAIIGLTNTLEGGLAFTEFLQEEIEKKGLEFDDDGIAAILNDDEAYRRVKSRTKKRGYSIGLVNAITYGIAGTLARSGRNIKRLGDLKIGSVKLPTSKILPGPQTAIRSTTEMVGGGLGEVAGRAAAGQEMDVAEIGFEALGEIGSPEAVIPSFKNASYTIDGENVTRNDVLDAINGPREDLIGMEITIKNDATVDNEVQLVMKKALIEKRVKEGLTTAQNENITPEQMNQLIDLNIEYETFKGSNTPDGNRNAKKIDEQIKQITDAIQEPSTETIPVPKQPETSPAVGTGDTQGAVPAGEIAPEETQATQPAEEVTTEVEDDASEVEPALTQEDLLENETIEEGEHAEDKGKVFTRVAQVTEKDGVTTTTFFFNRSDKNKSQRNKGGVSEKALEKRGYQISKEDREIFEDDLAEGVTVNYEVTEIREGETGAGANVTVIVTRPDGSLTRQAASVTLEPLTQTEQVTQEEVVEETYTLPENPKERVADFEIIDNRKGQEDFEIDEEGNGKWIIRNIKTGIILPLKRKSDAEAELQKIKINKETFDYGEGEVIIEEFQTTEKQTPPPKPKGKKTKDSSSEIDKTLAEFDKPMGKITPKILQLSFGNVYAQAKKFLGRLPRGVTNVVQEQLRSIPTPKIDFILGNYNSTLFYRKFFLPLVKSYQQYADKFGQKEQIIENAEAKLLKEAKGNNNKKVINSYKIAIAQKALIHESNPDSDVTPPVLVLLNRTIKLADDGDILSPLAAKELTKLRDTYLKDGGITFKNVYNSLTPIQQDVFKTLQEENKKLEPFAERAARRRGDTFQKLNDYSHRIVLEDNEQEIDVLKKKANDYADPNTKAANTLNREPNAKPAVSFDPFLSSLRATQEVYLDYYMSPDVSKVQQLSDAFVKKYSNGNKGQIAASKGIDKTIKELLRVTYLRSFVNTSGRTNFATTAKRWGYRLLLGSAPRFLAELAGNSTMLLTEDPIVIKNAVGKYGKFSMKIGGDANNKFINFLTELKSGETTKLGGKLKGDSKYSDRSGILNIDSSNRGLYNPILNKMEQLSKIPKLITYDVTAYVSDILMAGGDRFIARPLWVSKFANEFKKNVKKYLNEDIELSLEDLNEISNGTSKYLTNNKFKKALQEAVIESDRTTINITTSSNPFNAITKMVKRNEAADYYRTINSFMANFTLNEYATARFAINAMFRSGELSKKQASLLMTGVLARMSSYVLIYGLLADLLDEELFDAPADDDEDLDLLLYRQMIGSVMTLMFRQNLGNITSLPINLGLEELNKKYLDGLRDGKPYDSYDNSIVYSLITLDRLDKGLDEQIVPILTGPYVEYYKTARRAIELYNRTKTRKTKKARDRAMKELEEIILLQVQGQLGMLPFYKDIIRAKRKKFYDENYKKSSGKSQGGIQRRD